MKKTILVIVESPGKIKKIEEYLNLLGDYKYIVKASFGHCRDLDSKSMSIDIENNFNPNYRIIPGKEKVVKELKALKKDCEKVILASDEDREGEMIAESIKELLGLKNPDRIVFHEITKKAIHDAVKNPTTINYDMVYAQQARRLFDRLVGYKISPILWKKLKGDLLSAGRVQSVVVKIIVNKEKEILDSISNPYFKTTAKFDYKKNKFGGTLYKGKDFYKFESSDLAENFIKTIKVDDKFKVINSNIKDTKRKAPAPFITSTLQQEASTKLGYNVKRTMDAAQKLYESGYITYMRTDSTNLSEDAIKDCKDFITEKYGKEYSNPKNFSKNSKGAQEAHEAIRPTNVKTESTEGRVNQDAEKLYKLIRNRTLGSQMSDAIIELQTIKIDVQDKNEKSRLPKETLFVSTLENIKFPGFLILYNDKNNENSDSNDSETAEGQINIKEGVFVKNKEILISEEYSKLPLRFNEAGLIKHLEKNGIGRPSTYASIISKIIERNYVEIKNIDGFRKKSKQFKLTNSKTEIKLEDKTKDIVIGKESKKICPTNVGIRVNDFLIENFDPIMQIDFTANFEIYLDKIAAGEAKWFNVLDKFYKLFSPIIDEINSKSNDSQNDDFVLLGNDEDGNEIYSGSSKYGPCVKVMDDGKWKYAANNLGNNISLDDAINLLKFPIMLGTHEKSNVYLHKGQYGFYIKHGKKTVSIKDKTKDENTIDFNYAKNLIESGDVYAIKSFKLKEKVLNVKKGPYGYYVQIIGTTSKKPKNIGIPKEVDIENINLEQLINIIGIKK